MNGKPTRPENNSCGAQNLSEGHADSFFNNLGARHHEFTTAGERVNSAFYVEVLKHLRDATQWKELKNGETNGSCTMTVLITPPS